MHDDHTRPKHVAIFGAGIAGLTAAHELIERGYEVEVYEPEEPNSFEKVCGIGGIARTQWSRAERPGRPARDSEGRVIKPRRARAGMAATEPLVFELERLLEDPIPFRKDSSELDAAAKRRLDKIAALLERHPKYEIEVRGFTHEAGTGPFAPPDRADFRRATAVVEYLRSQGVTTRLTPKGYGLGYRDDWTRTHEDRCFVDFHTVEDWIPGEHGFRFFPSFYHNVRDTMRRTPIAEDREPFIETPWTVADNVVPTTLQGINLEGRTPFVFPRKRVTSPQRLFDLFRESFAASRFTFKDIAMLEVKLFKYLTSCSARRQDYEQMSWWDFVEGDRYSRAFQDRLDQTPQALVAMTARQCDARTYGNIQMQIIIDQFSDGAQNDGTLNGPTSAAWFDHWRRYLESQGVVFRRGCLRGFELCDGELWPCVIVCDESDGAGRKTVLVRDYYVVALPLEEIHSLVREQTGLRGGDFDRVRAMKPGDPADAEPRGVLQHMSGIQYYFRSEIKFLRGHTVYADAEWGLSSVFQPQFWTTRRGWWDGYRGVLSVDICDWHTPSRHTGKSAWESEEWEIAEEVWRQITVTVPDRVTLAQPILYHLDDNILFEREVNGRKLPSGNRTRMLINLKGAYSQRPGRPGKYQVHSGRLVFAGTYMQTYFRLTTMEAANESGRHAVNAILERDGFQGDRCSTVNIEELEVDDLRYFVDLDRELHRQRLPHLLDILGVDELPRSWLNGRPDPTILGLSLGLVEAGATWNAKQ